MLLPQHHLSVSPAYRYIIYRCPDGRSLILKRPVQFTSMTDLTPILNELLKSHDARPTANASLTLQNIDEFLKEAYRIVSRDDGILLYLADHL
jgi:hypothetical protein